MKEGIHPEYVASRVNCACGTTFVTASTRGDQHVDICSKCHPFYTGTMKLMDTAGRIDRFKKRYEGKVATPKKKEVAAEAAAPVAAEPAAEPSTEN